MLSEISEIKSMRIAAGMTQAELAKLAGVSQAMIARIESSSVDPSYSSVKKIFSVLDKISRHHKKELIAEDIMSRRVLTIEHDRKIYNAACKMKQYGISQLPVINKEKIVGTISEKDIAHAISERKKPIDLLVEDVMAAALPTVDAKTSFDALSHILDFNSALIVMKNGSVAGIISRADILGAMKK